MRCTCVMASNYQIKNKRMTAKHETEQQITVFRRKCWRYSAQLTFCDCIRH